MNDNNIYRGPFDAIAFFVLYCLLPIANIVAYIIIGQKRIFMYAVIVLLGLIYDCYTRFKRDMTKKEKKMIFAIGGAVSFMLVASLVFIVLDNAGVKMSNAFCLFYVPLCLPLVISVFQAINLVRNHMKL